MCSAAKVTEILSQLSVELQRLGLWQQQRPSEQALASSQPFCIDTLNFPQWLQFVFIEKMAALISRRGQLPGQCGIAPLAEEYFKASAEDGDAVLGLLLHLDRVLTPVLSRQVL